MTFSLRHITVEAAVREIEMRVVGVRAVGERVEAARRGLLALAVSVALVTILALVEAAGELSSTARTFLAAGLAVFVFLPSLIYALLPVGRLAGILPAKDLLHIAEVVGGYFPAIRDRLRNALQLARLTPEKDWVSSELAAHAIRGVAGDIAAVNLSDAVDRKPFTTARTIFVAAWILPLLAMLALPGSFSGGLYRLWEYDREFTPPPRYTFLVSPGNVEVVKGADVIVRVDVRAQDGRRVDGDVTVAVLHRAEGQQDFERTSVYHDSTGSHTASLASLRFSTSYFATADRVESEHFLVTVVDRPAVNSFRVKLEAPAYTRLPVRVQEEFAGNVSAPAGTKVTITGSASKDLSSGAIVFGDSNRTLLTVGGDRFSGSFRLSASGTYYVHISDGDGLSNASPIRYELTVTPDLPPMVRVVEPGRNMDIAGGDPIGLLVQAADDYGLSLMRLGYRLTHSRYEQPQENYSYLPMPFDASRGPETEVSYQWDLESLSLVPEDVVEYFVEVSDNNTVTGPSTTRSLLYTLRLPSLGEVFTDVEKGHEQSLEHLDTALEEAKKLKEEVERISQDLKTNKEIDWQKQLQAKDLQKKTEEIQKKLDAAQQQLQDMTQQMQQQQVLSPETMEKYQELQDLFQQINSDELQKALKQMQQAMQNVNKDQLRQALEKAEFSEERFRQGIERTINLLKRIEIEQKMDEVRKRANDLAERQEQLRSDSTRSSTPNEEQVKQQQDLAAEQKRMEQESAALQKKMEEFFTEMPADKLAELNKSMEQQKLDEKMQEAARHMGRGNQQQAQQMQREIGKELQQFSQQMNALQQELLQNQAQQTLSALRRATNNLLELSRRQEGLKNEAQSTPSNSPKLRENAQNQMRVMQDLSNVIDGLSELAQKSFAVTPGMGKELGEALGRMQNAMRNLDVRSGSMASQEQTGAMASLNRAAQQVQAALQAMMQQGQGSPGGMGLMQQLQMMAGQQAALNMQTQQIGEGEAMRRAAEAARIAREQEAVRKSVEQLNREAQGSDEQRRVLGDLQKIAEEMREVVRNLEQNNVNPETIRRQERILSRLLDASRSMRERDFEKKRQARTGTQITRRSPGEIDANAMERRTKLREDLMRALEQGYAKDYQDLIRKYFEELERVEGEESMQ
ncbi:MAG: hypothetical protein A2X68_11365 [Ignavibacteria bacterium GWC2_56_12]|nr:MAG: hypothetical protein A2X68_11365 [Ignavibacteria bacterium GWC2_56_12]